MKKILGVLVLIIAVLVIIGVVSSISSAPKSATVIKSPSAPRKHTLSPSTTTGSTASTAPALGAIEAVSTQSGHPYTVQVTSITDPATPSSSFEAPSAGKRLVAVNLVLVNKSTSIVQDDANITTTVVGTNNQTYQPSFDTVTTCTNFNSGQFTLTADSSSSGCVVFDLPDSVHVTKVLFEPTSLLSAEIASWTVTS
jgi:hypothetical protein